MTDAAMLKLVPATILLNNSMHNMTLTSSANFNSMPIVASSKMRTFSDADWRKGVPEDPQWPNGPHHAQ